MMSSRIRTFLFFGVSGLLLLAAPATSQERLWPQFEGYDVPFVPTPYEVVDEMLKLAGPKPGDVLYDLGCGDGRIVIRAAKAFDMHGPKRFVRIIFPQMIRYAIPGLGNQWLNITKDSALVSVVAAVGETLSVGRGAANSTKHSSSILA